VLELAAPINDRIGNYLPNRKKSRTANETERAVLTHSAL